MISLKISSSRGQEVIRIRKDTTFSNLINEICQKTSISVESCQISGGYPPKIIHGKSDDPLSLFSDLETGCAVTVRDMKPASLTNFQTVTMKEVTHLMSMGYSRLVSEQAFEIAGSDIDLAVEVAQGILTANEGEPSCKDLTAVGDRKDQMIVSRLVISADNSCLFNALGYVMVRDKHKMGSIYRKVIADEILQDAETYSADILGMAVQDYVKWILNPEKWGGEIEMNILSKYFQMEIAAVDVETGKLYVYGEAGNYSSRVYLLYDGIHYDAIVSAILSSSGEIDESKVTTIFQASDTQMAYEAGMLATELRKKKKFVNMTGCQLQCLVCLTGLKGQKEAQAHAKETGHQNFGQVDT
jgi:ubiquitin thioesterase OTU1